MKRIIIILLVISAIAFAACSHEPPELSRSFVCDLTAESPDAEYTGRVTRSAESVTLSITSPPEVAGISYTMSDTELRTSLDGLTCVTSADSLSPSSLPAIVCAALYGLDNAAYVSSENGRDIYTVSSAIGDITVTAEGGLPVSVTTEKGTFSISLDASQTP